MNDATQQTTPTIKQALTPSGQNSTMSIGGALAVVLVAYFHTQGVDFPAGVEAALAVIMTCGAGYFHEFVSIMLTKLRG